MSAPLVALLDNGALWWGLAACGTAQFSKLVIELVVHRRWNPKVLVETGGMPSSHSALLTGTASALGWHQGFDSGLFALAAIMCFVVLYDASHVRYSAGLTAARVNALSEASDEQTPLKEKLGHTPFEVLVGSLMGPLISLPGLVLVGSPLNLAQHWGLMAIG